LYFRFLHRSTLTVVFEGGEAGMTAYYCSRYENEKGDAGNWGPTALAVVT
jgi:hypothetical protein